MCYENLISVIISTYNRKEYLEKAINSVLKQTYKNVEIIIIDDYSTDGTEQFINERYNLNEKIKYYRNSKNLGPGINRLKAFKDYSNGKYIIFLDDDDCYIDFEYFQKAINLLKKDKSLAFVAANHCVNNLMDKKIINHNLKYNQVVNNKEFFENFGSEKYRKPIISVVIFDRDSFEKTGYQEMKIFNDTTIFLRALLYGNMGFIDSIALEYLVHGNNISFNCTCDFIINNLEEKYKISKKAKRLFKNFVAKQWLIEQSDITIIYYIKGSQPKFIDFIKIELWSIIRLKSIKKVKEYYNIYINNKNKDRMI